MHKEKQKKNCILANLLCAVLSSEKSNISHKLLTKNFKILSGKLSGEKLDNFGATAPK